MDRLKLIKITSCILLIQLSTYGNVCSQFHASAASEGLGGVSVTLSDLEAIPHNIALIDRQVPATLAIQSTMPYGVREFLQNQLIYSSNLGSGRAVMTLGRYGFDLYNEHLFSLGYALEITTGLHAGLTTGIVTRSIEGHGTVLSPLYEIDLAQKVTKTVILGMQLRNPVPFSKNRHQLVPTVFSLGLGYMVSKGVDFFLSAEGHAWANVRFRAGLAYRPIDVLVVRVGMSTLPAQLHCGFGLEVRSRVHLDSAITYSTMLGATPSVGITFTFKDNEDTTGSSDRK